MRNERFIIKKHIRMEDLRHESIINHTRISIIFENLYQLLGEEYGEEAKDLVNKLKGI